MSRRITVCSRGRKVLTKIFEGQTVEQFLSQVNQKNNTTYKHIWLSETGNEGEIDDLDVVDDKESVYLTEGPVPPVEEQKTQTSESSSSTALNSSSSSTINSSIDSPPVFITDHSTNGRATPDALNLDLLHHSLSAVGHFPDGNSSDSNTEDNNSTNNTNNTHNSHIHLSPTSEPNSPFTTGGNNNSTGNHSHKSNGSNDNNSSVGNLSSSGSVGRMISTGSASSSLSRPSSGLTDAVNMADFLLEDEMNIFEPCGRVLLLGVFSLDFEESIQSYIRNPGKKKLKEQFMDKSILNAPTEEPYIMTPGNVVDIAVGHNTVVSVNEGGASYIAGAFLLVPACLGQPKPRVAPSPPFLHPDMLSVDIPSYKEIWSVSSGAYHSACITRDNEVITWGYNINCLVTGSKATEIETSIKDRKYIVSGQLGHPVARGQKSPYFSLPQTVEGLLKYGDICQVSCGGAHTAALTADGKVLTWGANDEGQLGWNIAQMKQYASSVPTPVLALSKIRIAHIACGSHHTLVCDVRGRVYSWGYNSKGQLGTATPDVICPNPQHVSAISEHKVEMVAAGATHSVVLTNAGIVLTWGSNEFGELGRTKHKSRPEQPTKLSDHVIVHIAAGPGSTAAVSEDGLGFVWGKLAGEKMSGHEVAPRMIQTMFDKKYFICKVGCGLTHFSFLTDDRLSGLIDKYIQFCDNKSPPQSEELTQATMDLAPSLLRRVQSRAYKNILDKRKDAPTIKVSKTQLFFGATESESFVSIQDLTVTNTSQIKLNISGSLDCGSNKTHLSFEPKSFEGVKPGQTVTFKVALASSIKMAFRDIMCIIAEPSKGKVAGLRYFVVYNYEEREETPSLPRIPSPGQKAATVRQRQHTTSNKSPSLLSKSASMPRSVIEKPSSTLRNQLTFSQMDIANADIEIFERLGSGGSLATVYRCTLNGFTCAMKELGEATNEVQASFLNEITLIESLSNDNIIRYLGHYVTPSRHIRLFMEYYPMSLADLIKKRKYIPSSEALIIARDVAKGLEYLHRQNPPIIHRDIKPGNCLLALDSLERVKVVKITDFDISKALFEGAAAMTCAGTTIYMAPEVFSGKPYSIEADVWSFGMMMVEIITLKHPYSQHRNFDVPKLICDGVLPELTPEIIADESYKPLTDIVYECFKDVKSRPSAKDIVNKLFSIM